MTYSQFLLPLVCLLGMGGVALFVKAPAPAPLIPPGMHANPATGDSSIAAGGSTAQSRTDPSRTDPARPGAKETPLQETPEAQASAAAMAPEVVPRKRDVPATLRITYNARAAEVAGLFSGTRPPAPALPEAIEEAAPPGASSWENPFSADQWKSTGWKFSSTGMETVDTDNCSATFLRPYRRLMFECEVLGTGVSDASWELKLATADGSTMSIIVRPERVTVLSNEGGMTRLIVDKPVTTQLLRGVPRQFRVVATGNRLVISWDRRKLFTTGQIASQSGREVKLSIQANGGAFRVPRMRIEGD